MHILGERARVIIIKSLDAPKSVLETEKTLKTLSSGQIYIKKTKKNKKTKKTTGLGFCYKNPALGSRAGLSSRSRFLCSLTGGGGGGVSTGGVLRSIRVCYRNGACIEIFEQVGSDHWRIFATCSRTFFAGNLRFTDRFRHTCGKKSSWVAERVSQNGRWIFLSGSYSLTSRARLAARRCFARGPRLVNRRRFLRRPRCVAHN